jgi:hypothetical protein
MIVLTQIPRLVEIGAVGLVVAGILIHQEGATAPDGTRRPTPGLRREPGAFLEPCLRGDRPGAG